MLLFRVPENIADQVAQMVLDGQQPPEKEKDFNIEKKETRGMASSSSSSSNAAASSSSSSAAQANSSSSSSNAKNKVVLDIKPDHEVNKQTQPPSNDRFLVTIHGRVYPALLMNIPTPVEAQKQFERHNVLKSGDIGQILQVFNNEEELLHTKATIKSPAMSMNNKDGKPNMSENDIYMGSTMCSGITSASSNIVKNRYELTRRSTIPSVDVVTEIAEEIKQVIMGIRKDKDTNHSFVIETDEGGGDIQAYSTTEEEVVDFEDWMVDNEYPDGIKILIQKKNEFSPVLITESLDRISMIKNFDIVQQYPEITLGVVKDVEEIELEPQIQGQGGAESVP